ncbi:MAG: thioredoxin domain-containing protein, partial [Chthonomonadaceae bacterium]|nr:thioredoxin domain-containing protein [Chthonomonadaceae bacterium]
MPNRLASEKSLYLRQHQDNPIDWWPWGDEAWDTANRLGRPVFLSVGYSSCHWCHVMAHESFEDPETAAALNESFISIKLDREERPDIDEIYMTAVQLANGHGGWPMTLFLTPNKKPFFAGTYFPKDARAGHPGFLTVINSLASAWENEKDSVLKAADDFAVALAAALERSMPGSNDLSLELILAAIAEFHTSFDHENGGFGDQPKFPPFSALEFLDKCSHSPLLEQELDLRLDCAAMVSRTVKALSQGGITDHVGGGIHRYSTDSHWHLPHFEKMLTDNAQWVSVLCNTDPDSFALRRAIDWIESKMTGSDGTFFSAMDADSEGQEGAYYLWREQEVLDLTSPAFAFAFGVKSEGNFHDEATGQLSGLNVLNFQGPSIEQYSSELDALSGGRQKRTSPLTDKKAVAAGNGLMISALSRVRPDLALRAAETWLHHLRLPRFLYEGQPYGEAFLDDLAYMARG